MMDSYLSSATISTFHTNLMRPNFSHDFKPRTGLYTEPWRALSGMTVNVSSCLSPLCTTSALQLPITGMAVPEWPYSFTLLCWSLGWGFSCFKYTEWGSIFTCAPVPSLSDTSVELIWSVAIHSSDCCLVTSCTMLQYSNYHHQMTVVLHLLYSCFLCSETLILTDSTQNSVLSCHIWSILLSLLHIHLNFCVHFFHIVHIFVKFQSSVTAAFSLACFGLACFGLWLYVLHLLYLQC